MASSNSKNKISSYTTLIFLILLLMCALPPMIEAAGSSDYEDSTLRKSRGYQQAVSYIKKSDYGSAIPLLRRELKNNPKNADAHNYMGYALRKSDDLKNSAVHYTKALEINPQHLGALEYQGELYLTIGNLDLAKANLQKLDKLCWLGCDEYDELRASIEDYQQGRKNSKY
ncbi:MAG: tetratricopeptide repeat protein [SAR324 cluster bacterium]|nr:tetratricopeptide repeat protein [SAR324 cluster bacterium]